MGFRVVLIFCLFLRPCADSFGQGELQEADNISRLSPKALSKYLAASSQKANDIQKGLDRKTAKALERMQKLELQMQKKLSRIDSAKAVAIFGKVKEKYQGLDQKIRSAGSFNQYIPSLDTLATSLKFLDQNKALLSNIKEYKEKLNTTLSKVKGLQDQFQKTEEIRKFLKERKEMIRQQLSNLGFAKELKKMNKQVYYFSQQANQYKELLKDHKKAEKKAVELLSKTKLFKDFMRKNSQLASLFRLPGDPNDPIDQAGLAGLQTRAQVNNLIQQQLAAGGPGAQQQFQQNLQSAQSQLNQLKNKVSQLGQSSSDVEMPEGFKPNSQKTKSFLNRLELGTNIQSQKASGYFPTTSDIGLSLGYKPNDKSVLGIGASYKLGLGQNIRNINITHQGMGLRSFVDWKIKGSFWLSGGYEMNYRNEFNRIEVLKDLNAWQQSGLIGVSKVISLKTKFLKNTKLQVLWDFLSYQQRPQTQVILFRVGYSIK
jgi:hypothetical protein